MRKVALAALLIALSPSLASAADLIMRHRVVVRHYASPMVVDPGYVPAPAYVAPPAVYSAPAYVAPTYAPVITPVVPVNPLAVVGNVFHGVGYALGASPCHVWTDAGWQQVC